jgi:anthranilate phosphoribosyltransferase
MAPVLAEVVAARGDRALVFRGDDGLDELTTATTSRVWVAREGAVTAAVVDPGELGIAPSGPDALRGGDPAHNAGVFRRLLGGERGPVRDAVLLNAAAAVAAFDGGNGDLGERLGAGLERASAALADGRAAALLDRWVTVSRELAPA